MTSVAAIIEQNSKPEQSSDRPRFQEQWSPACIIPANAKSGDLAVEIKKSNRRPFPRYSYTKGVLRERNGERFVAPYVNLKIDGQFTGTVDLGQQPTTLMAIEEDAIEWITEAAKGDVEEHARRKTAAPRNHHDPQQQRPVRATGKTERDREKKKLATAK